MGIVMANKMIDWLKWVWQGLKEQARRDFENERGF